MSEGLEGQRPSVLLCRPSLTCLGPSGSEVSSDGPDANVVLGRWNMGRSPSRRQGTLGGYNPLFYLKDCSVIFFQYASLVSCLEPCSFSMDFSFIFLPVGNAKTVILRFLLFCLLNPTPVDPFGRSRLDLKYLISIPLTHISGRLQHLPIHSAKPVCAQQNLLKPI